MRADRLLSLTLLLRHRGRMTAAALAAELEVSPRTVLRDVEALSAAGIPVYAERGRSGGFALLPGFSTDVTGLTPREAVALLTSGSTTTPSALGMGRDFSSAMRKVVAAMPAQARRDAAGAAERVLVRRGGWLTDPAGEPVDALATVQHAVFAGRRLRILYRSRGHDEPRRRTVDPLGLVEAAGRWYLLATDRDAGGTGTDPAAERTYRVSRIRSAEELDEPARRPDGVDLEQLWLRRRAEFRARNPGVTVRIRLAADRRAELDRISVREIGTDQGDGALEVEAVFGDLPHAGRVLWPMLPGVAVLDPPELRAALAARARDALATLS